MSAIEVNSSICQLHVLYPERWIEGVMIVALWRLIALGSVMLAAPKAHEGHMEFILEAVKVRGLLRNLLRSHAGPIHPLAEETEVCRPRAELLHLAQDSKDGKLLVR